MHFGSLYEYIIISMLLSYLSIVPRQAQYLDIYGWNLDGQDVGFGDVGDDWLDPADDLGITARLAQPVPDDHGGSACLEKLSNFGTKLKYFSWLLHSK